MIQCSKSMVLDLSSHDEREKESMLTYFINHGVAIAETAGRATVEINAVREIVGLGKGRKVVVIPIVNQRVPEHEHGWHHL
jgi:hypothetical protein